MKFNIWSGRLHEFEYRPGYVTRHACTEIDQIETEFGRDTYPYRRGFRRIGRKGAQEFVDAAFDIAGACENEPAGIRAARPGGGSFVKGDAQTPLQRFHPSRHRCPAHAQHFGRGRDRSSLSGHAVETEIIPIEHCAYSQVSGVAVIP
ncbi:hypothetical protein ACFB49_33980 [Sphingomonas sp. DBB INV C78]